MQNREEYLKDLEETYSKKPSNYAEFMKYFRKNWYNVTFVNQPLQASSKLRITNNCCEGYNSRLGKLLGKHPLLPIFVQRLLEEELYFKNYTLKSISSGGSQEKGVILTELYPFEHINYLLERLEQSEPEHHYELRSFQLNKEFFENIVRLTQLGYSKYFQENPFEEDKENDIESQSEEEDYIENNEEIDFINHKKR